MKKFRFSFFGFPLLSLLLFSCNREDVKIMKYDDVQLIQRSSLEVSDQEYEDYMEGIFQERNKLAVAISCLPDELRNSLFNVFKSICHNNIENGHYENELFFFKENNTTRAELGGMTIEQLLLQNKPELKSTLDFLCQYDPALSILLIKGDGSNLFNDKVFIDNEIEEQDPNSTIEYAYQCSMSSSLISEVPSIQSFVIREAECSLRDEDVVFNNSLEYPQPTIDLLTSCGYITIYNYPPVSGGGPNDPGDPCDEECDRDCIDCKENMEKFRARKDYDGAFKGKGEWNFYVIYAEDVAYTVVGGNVSLVGDALSYVVKRDEGVDDSNTWRTKNFDIIRWDLDRPDADRMKYVLYEDDKGKARDVTIPLKFTIKLKIAGQEVTPGFETGIPIRISKGDDFIGESIVDYCDNIGFEYHPGSNADFVCNERCN